MLCDEVLNYCELNEDTCENDGKCTSISKDDGSFRCECPSGYRGSHCEIAPPQMFPSTTSGSVRPSKMPVVITSMRPQNKTTAASIVSSTTQSGSGDDVDDDEEIDNEAK